MHIMIPPPLNSELHWIWNKVTTALGQQRKLLRGGEKQQKMCKFPDKTVFKIILNFSLL